MKKFKVNVNGKSYQVEVEELANCGKCPKVETNNEEEFMCKVTKQVAAAKPSGAVCEVKAPIPGVIVEISASEGASVKAGDRILVLEAMKMENAILSPVSGTVEKILITKGKPVNGNQLMLTIK